MRLLSSIALENSLSYKMPLRFNNLDIGGGFPLLQNAPSISTTVSYKDIPFAAKCQSHFQGLHMQRNIVATKCNVVFNIIHQDSFKHHHSSQYQYRSIQINTDVHHHAELFCLVLFIVLRQLSLLISYKNFYKPVFMMSFHCGSLG